MLMVSEIRFLADFQGILSFLLPARGTIFLGMQEQWHLKSCINTAALP